LTPAEGTAHVKLGDQEAKFAFEWTEDEGVSSIRVGNPTDFSYNMEDSGFDRVCLAQIREELKEGQHEEDPDVVWGPAYLSLGFSHAIDDKGRYLVACSTDDGSNEDWEIRGVYGKQRKGDVPARLSNAEARRLTRQFHTWLGYEGQDMEMGEEGIEQGDEQGQDQASFRTQCLKPFDHFDECLLRFIDANALSIPFCC
jgi:hypothetical protein